MVSKTEYDELYSKAQCRTADPVLFDQVEYNQITDAALKICASCTVTFQCFAIVDPHNSSFDGVCAGMVWRNGKSITAPNIHPTTKAEIHDYIAIERLIDGSIDWKQVKLIDRRKAAILMFERGTSKQIILEKCHMSGHSLNKLIKREGL